MSGISLDEIVFTTGSGAVDSDTLRVELSTESLAALENIEATIASGAKIIITDGTDDLEINADGSVNAVVSATDLDIRDLAFATDKVDVTGSEVALDAATLAALETITVVATDLDIRDLAFATDKVDVSGSVISTTVSPLAAIKTTAETVTTTAAQVVSTPLADRLEITIQNEGNQDVYIGSTSGVTSSTGIKISKNSSATYSWGPDVDIFMISASGSQSVRFLEAS